MAVPPDTWLCFLDWDPPPLAPHAQRLLLPEVQSQTDNREEAGVAPAHPWDSQAAPLPCPWGFQGASASSPAPWTPAHCLPLTSDQRFQGHSGRFLFLKFLSLGFLLLPPFPYIFFCSLFKPQEVVYAFPQ